MGNKARVGGIVASAFVAAAAALAGGLEALRLAPAEEEDLRPERLVAVKPGGRLANAARDRARFSWPLADRGAAAEAGKSGLNPQGPMRLRSRPPVMRSREYWMSTSGVDLNAGVLLETTGPGALVRVHPLPGLEDAPAAGAIDPEAFEILDESGQVYGRGTGMDLLVSAEKLREADTPFPAGTCAFRLKPELGAGRFILRAAGAAEPKRRYAVHVFDRNGSVVLSIQAERDAYLAGQELVVTARLEDGGRPARAQALAAVVRAPSGREEALKLEPAGRGRWQGRVPLFAEEEWAPGLWEAHVLAAGSARGLAFRRFVKTAFAVAVPTARLDGEAVVDRRAARRRELAVHLGLEVAAEGRYEVRGVLFGTDEAGRKRPLAAASGAAWLEPGQRQLTLAFERKALDRSGLSSPFEVRDVQLLDQSRLGLLQRQARGFTLP
jgi:hypothetical protein